MCIEVCASQRYSVADLHSKILDASHSNFLHFHAVFGEIRPNYRLAPPSTNNDSKANNDACIPE